MTYQDHTEKIVEALDSGQALMSGLVPVIP